MMKRLRHLVVPVMLSLAVVLSLTAGVQAYTGGTLPGWGGNSGKGLKSGPLGVTSSLSPGEVPIAIKIPDANVDAEVEKNKIVNGQMLDPSGPWVVSWYQETGKAGDTLDYRNMVLSGHVDYWDVGPSVFQDLSKLTKGAQISVTGENGNVYTYAVNDVYLVPAQPDQKQLDDIVAPQKTSVLTIITCGGDFNYDKGEYDSRTIVRASLVGTQVGGGTAGTASSASDNSGATSLQKGDQAQVKDNNVNLRADASTGADIVATLNDGDTVTVTGDSKDADGYTWWPVQTADGKTGWIVQDYLTKAGQ